jgi:serine/threonine-protein kinase
MSREHDTADTVVERAGANRRVADGDTVRCAIPEPIVGEAPLATVSRFTDEGEIARGGMASVRRVYDHHMLRHAAMKVIDRTGLSREETLRFLEEAQITGQLDHPHIVPIYDLEVGPDGMPLQFTMKLVRGQTLDELLEIEESSRSESSMQKDALRLERLLNIFLRVCEAVSFAHGRGVIHRDLKPQNVMVGAHGQVYVMDWGVALLCDGPRPSERGDGVRRDPLRQSAERPGMVVGTVVYMAPEQATGQLAAIDARTDVFGLGGILYKILTGKPPHHGADSFLAALDLARRGEVPAVEQAAPGRALPPGLCRIVMKALAAKPDDRHESVAMLQEDVEGFLRGGGWFVRRQFPAGSVMMREGELGDCAYLIDSGHCEVSRTVDGERQVVRTLGPGEVVGESAILIDRPRSATVMAIDDVTALTVTRESLQRELARNDWLATIARALAERFLDLDRTLRG